MFGELLNETEVAKKLRVSLACLRRWRLEKRGPAFVKIGQLVRYRPEELELWIQSLPTGGLVHARADTKIGFAPPSGARPNGL
jgi:predicted DNA-binding transcriptional regulator AlpA